MDDDLDAGRRTAPPAVECGVGAEPGASTMEQTGFVADRSSTEFGGQLVLEGLEDLLERATLADQLPDAVEAGHGVVATTRGPSRRDALVGELTDGGPDDGDGMGYRLEPGVPDTDHR